MSSGIPLKRIFDFTLACILLGLCCLPLFLIAVMVKISSPGPVLYWSDRIGINNSVFKMPKFRTMKVDTPPVPTHLLSNPDFFLTPVGPFLRKYSLDELPQLWSILNGDMSFIGPRPALFNQDDLVALRTGKGIHRLMPGITGWAQVNGRDNIPIPEKVQYEEYYLKNKSFLLDLKILYMTALKVLKAEDVRH